MIAAGITQNLIVYASEAEKKLKETIHLDINFEAEDALAKLEKLGAIKNENETWFPLPMEETAKDIKNREGIN